MINSAVKTRFLRDALPFQLGALAANLARIETFAKQPWLERRGGALVRSLVEESVAFIELTACNMMPDSASDLVRIQVELATWLRDWNAIAGDASRREEVARKTSEWSVKVLGASGLRDGVTHRNAAPTIPAEHKFALIALPGVWHGIDVVEQEDVMFSRVPPVELDDHWVRWLGDLWRERFENAGFYATAMLENARPLILDAASEEVSQRGSDIMAGLAVAVRHFKCDRGVILVGGISKAERRVPSVSDSRRVFNAPGAPTLQVFEVDLLRACRYASAIRGIRRWPRLFASVHVFMDGLMTPVLRERIHAFVRSVEGLLRTEKGNGKRQFVNGVQSVMKTECRHRLSTLYEIRGAEEHLRDPLSQVEGVTDDDRWATLARYATEAECIARYFVSRVLENPALINVLSEADRARAYWDSAEKSKLGGLLDLDMEMAGITTDSLQRFRTQGWSF